MDPSSLIFFAVVALWVVYLIHGWTQRHPEALVEQSEPDSFATQGQDAANRKRVDLLAWRFPGLLTGLGVAAPRRVRGLTALVHLGLVPGYALLAVFQVVGWWVPILGTLAAGLAVGWLRDGVAQERGQRRGEARRMAAEGSGRSDLPTVQLQPPADRERPSAAMHPRDDQGLEAARPKRREPVLYDFGSDPAPGRARAAVLPEAVLPHGVPRPTYLLKQTIARAPIPEPEVSQRVPAAGFLVPLPATETELVAPTHAVG